MECVCREVGGEEALRTQPHRPDASASNIDYDTCVPSMDALWVHKTSLSQLLVR